MPGALRLMESSAQIGVNAGQEGAFLTSSLGRAVSLCPFPHITLHPLFL